MNDSRSCDQLAQDLAREKNNECSSGEEEEEEEGEQQSGDDYSSEEEEYKWILYYLLTPLSDGFWMNYNHIDLWGLHGACRSNDANWAMSKLGGGSMAGKYGKKTKDVAMTGAKKVKQGTSIGIQWIKDKYQKTTQKH
ncbi:hypothetical protein Tco_0553990 [Tanacetum coccineum]